MAAAGTVHVFVPGKQARVHLEQGGQACAISQFFSVAATHDL